MWPPLFCGPSLGPGITHCPSCPLWSSGTQTSAPACPPSFWQTLSVCLLNAGRTRMRPACAGGMWGGSQPIRGSQKDFLGMSGWPELRRVRSEDSNTGQGSSVMLVWRWHYWVCCKVTRAFVYGFRLKVCTGVRWCSAMKARLRNVGLHPVGSVSRSC